MLCEIKLILYMLAAAVSFPDMQVYAKNSECQKKCFCKDPVKEECLGISSCMPKYSRPSYRLVLNFPSHFPSYPYVY